MLSTYLPDWSRRRKVMAVVAIAATVPLYALLRPHLEIFYNPLELRDFVQGFGPFAPLVFVGLMAVQVLVAPLPGGIFSVVSGMLFGTVWGTVIVFVGAGIGTIIALFLSRRYGRPMVERLIGEGKMEHFDHLSEEYGFMPYILFILLPGIPPDAVCFLAGLTELDFKWLAIYGIVFRLPAFIAFTATGDTLVVYGVEHFMLMAVGLIVIAAVALLGRHRIAEFAKNRKVRKES